MPGSMRLALTPKLTAVLAALIVGGVSAASGSAADHGWQNFPLNEGTFDVSSASSARFETLNGRDALCINGEAFARDVTLRNGSIAVDIANDNRRHFANIIFRAASNDTYETAYLRMHKSGQFDAVQYTPHLNGETNWQLFGEAQARAQFGNDPWITLRVDFAGDRAKVSLGGTDNKPALVTHLTLPVEQGAIGLRTLFEGCFSNFRYSSTMPSLPDEGLDENAYAQDGLIEQWSLSDSFPIEAWAGLSASLPESPHWRTAESESNGRLLISRHRRKQSAGAFERNQLDAVYAGVAIYSDGEQTAALQIDASDMATVWLNGEVLFSFDNSFRAKGALFRGDFDVSKQSLSLSLSEGRNDLVVLVAERANGWGLAAAVSAEKPVRIEPFETAK